MGVNIKPGIALDKSSSLPNDVRIALNSLRPILGDNVVDRYLTNSYTEGRYTEIVENTSKGVSRAKTLNPTISALLPTPGISYEENNGTSKIYPYGEEKTVGSINPLGVNMAVQSAVVLNLGNNPLNMVRTSAPVEEDSGNVLHTASTGQGGGSKIDLHVQELAPTEPKTARFVGVQQPENRTSGLALVNPEHAIVIPVSLQRILDIMKTDFGDLAYLHLLAHIIQYGGKKVDAEANTPPTETAHDQPKAPSVRAFIGIRENHNTDTPLASDGLLYIYKTSPAQEITIQRGNRSFNVTSEHEQIIALKQGDTIQCDARIKPFQLYNTHRVCPAETFEKLQRDTQAYHVHLEKLLPHESLVEITKDQIPLGKNTRLTPTPGQAVFVKNGILTIKFTQKSRRKAFTLQGPNIAFERVAGGFLDKDIESFTVTGEAYSLDANNTHIYPILEHLILARGQQSLIPEKGSLQKVDHRLLNPIRR